MNFSKKNIRIYVLAVVFLQPYILNNLHFALVSHDYNWDFENLEKASFNGNNDYHNCEQYLFKNPPQIEIDFIKEIIVNFTFEFKEIRESEIKLFFQAINFKHYKRGPPKLKFHKIEHSPNNLNSKKNKMKKYIIASAAIISTITFQSCSSDDDSGTDTQKPVIILNVPTDHQQFFPGEEFHLEADFSDNVELGSYKVEIHSAADGHEHKNGDAEGEWSHSQSVQINSGLKNMSIHEHIDIPTEVDGVPIVEGHYHLGIFLTDKAGNEQQLFTEIVIGEDIGH